MTYPIQYGGQTFTTRRALATHLASVTGHGAVACENTLRRLDEDPVRVIAYYRDADAVPVQAFRYNGLTFRTQRELGQHLVPLVGRSLSVCLGKLYEFGNDAEQLVEHYRQADDISGLGALAQELRMACRDGGFTRLDDLTVLTADHDPYRFDNSTGRAEAQWFADVVARFVPDGAVHLRGLHYRLVSSTAPVPKPDGQPYRNTDDDWVWLQADASGAGRWLGLVPFEKILDERNDPPVLPDDDRLFGDPGIRRELVSGMTAGVPELDEAMPSIEWAVRPERQPYRIVLFGEKSSLAPVLGPIRDRVNGELLLPTGESTTTMVFNLARRCVADGRPAVIGYFSDFDPAGWQMGISVARKLQALKTLRFPTLDVRLYPVALDYEQVTQLDLPSTPLKETEKRGDKWRTAWNHEQTEIDALAALNPAELTGIAEEFIRPFFDPTLARRTAQVERVSRDAATATLAAHPQYRDARASIRAALADLERAKGDLEMAQETAMEDLQDVELPALPELPKSVIKVPAPEPLFASRDDYVTTSLKLKRHRALYPDADE